MNNEFQRIAFDALQELDRIFSRNGIKYVLLAGSTLGAVRHKGFIPWDDDIDVGIMLEDRDKAYRLLKDNLSEKYQWADRNVNEHWPRLYGKILYNGYGCVDVFTVIKTSDNAIARQIQWINRKILFKIYKQKKAYVHSDEMRNGVEKAKVFLTKCISRVIPQKMVLTLIEKNEALFQKSTNNRFYLNLYSPYTLEKELILAEWINTTSFVTFEGKKFPTVCDTDAYLSHLYGEYMILPDEKDRVARHGERFE